MRQITDFQIKLPSLKTVLTTDEHAEIFYFGGIPLEELPEDYFLNVSEADKKLIYQYTKLEVTAYAELWQKNLITKIDRSIIDRADAMQYIDELIANNEYYNFTNSAIDMVNWPSRTPSVNECYQLDRLRDECIEAFSNDWEQFDGYVLDKLKSLNKF
jgi:hypothetical protein